jgi:hypothetical protein
VIDAPIYHQTRPHRTLDGKTSEQLYYDNLTIWFTAASSDRREVPLKESNMLSKQLGPPPYVSIERRPGGM